MAWIKTNLKQYKNEQKRIDEYMDYKVKKGMEAHKTSTVLDHPDGSVTDEKIGNRTMINPISPSEVVTGTLTRLLSVISNAVQTLSTNLSQIHSTLDSKIDQGDRDTRSACLSMIEDAVDELESKIDQGNETTLVNANEYTRSYSYSKTAVDTVLNAKAEKATTLAGYGIDDAYTKGEVNGAITSPKDKFKFSNGVQLASSGNGIVAQRIGSENDIIFSSVIVDDDGDVRADVAETAKASLCDISGNRIDETYATKEELTEPKEIYKFKNGVSLKASVGGVYATATGGALGGLLIDSGGETHATYAECDSDGNNIGETYVTKKELGSIDTALDNIIAIQEELILPRSEGAEF